MPTEIEAKLKVDSFDAVRAALQAHHAERVGAQHETNYMLDRRDGSLRDHDSALRVRACRALDGPALPGRLTFKGPAQVSRFKSREELEVTVDDAALTVRILQRAGFQVTFLYEKRRETWRLGPCAVELDELPQLGCFVEIEGPDEAAVDVARRQLGLDGAPHVAGSYVHLLLAVSSPDRAANREFRLPA